MAQQSIVGSNTGLETAPTATWRPSISLVHPMFNENIKRAVHFSWSLQSLISFQLFDSISPRKDSSALCIPWLRIF